MKYKAIFFDLFGTLVENYPSVKHEENLKKIALELSIPHETFIKLWDAGYVDRMRGVINNYEDYLTLICNKLNMQPGNARIKKASGYRTEITRCEVSSAKDGAVEVLSYLKSNKYKTGLISNISMEAMHLWNNTEMASFIDIKVFSCAEGYAKPDRRIYEIALERLKVQPQDSLFVADGINRELAAAITMGMDALLIKPSEDDGYDALREEWSGPVITSLREIPAFIEKK